MSGLLWLFVATGGGGGGVPSLAWLGALVGLLVGLCTLLSFVVVWAMGYGALKRSVKSLQSQLNEHKAGIVTKIAELKAEFDEDLAEVDRSVVSHRAAVDAAIAKAIERADLRHEELTRQLQAFATESRDSLHKLQLDFVKALGEMGAELKRFADAAEHTRARS